MPPRFIRPVRMAEAVSEYLDWSRAVKGRARNTLRNTESVLRRLEKWLGNPMVYNIDRNRVNRYLGERGRDIAVDSVNQEKTRIKSFLVWCQEEQYLDAAKNVTRDLTWTKPLKTERLRLTADQFPALYDAALCQRDRALLITLTDTLMRGSEAVSLRWGQVRFDDSEIDFFRWKTKEEATVPMSAPLERELRNYRIWWEEKVERRARPDDHVLPALKVGAGVGKSDDTVQLQPDRPIGQVAPIVQKALVEVAFPGEAGKFSPLLREGGHTLRRSAARELLEALFRDESMNTDEALLMVMTMLGHKSIDMTMRYIGYDRDQQKVMRLLKGKDWWASAQPADVIVLNPRPRVANG